MALHTGGGLKELKNLLLNERFGATGLMYNPSKPRRPNSNPGYLRPALEPRYGPESD